MPPSRICLLPLLFGAAAAWSCDGHMTVAQIALDSGIMSPATISAANKLVAFLAPNYPSSGATFSEVACWADDIRSSEPTTSGWHFIDLPVCFLVRAIGRAQARKSRHEISQPFKEE